jgi:predicted AAA+ superfamily ATPase
MNVERELEAKMDSRFAEVWEILRENAVQMKETDRRMKETDQRMKETDRKIGRLGGRLGELIEHLVAPDILQKFISLGYSFTRYNFNVQIKDPELSLGAEIDILLENGDVALAVEVKSKLTEEDVKDHEERMKKLRRYADRRGDSRRFMGAVAGGIVSPEVKSFAFRNGFYVIEQSGDTMKMDIPEGFTPKEW